MARAVALSTIKIVGTSDAAMVRKKMPLRRTKKARQLIKRLAAAENTASGGVLDNLAPIEVEGPARFVTPVGAAPAAPEVHQICRRKSSEQPLMPLLLLRHEETQHMQPHFPTQMRRQVTTIFRRLN